jgi:hypothetical protein
MNPKRKTKENKIEEDYKDVRFALLAWWVLIIVCALMLCVPDRRLASTLIPSILAMGFFSFRGLREGRVRWWFFFMMSFCISLSLFFVLALIPFLRIKNPSSLLLLYSPIPIFSIFGWKWGAKRFGADNMREVLASKRIDIETATYSPFVLPPGFLAKELSNKLVRFGLIIGAPSLAAIGASVGFFVEKNTTTVSHIIVIICVYVLVPIGIGASRAGLGEYAWIHRWEKETGRKMYLAAIVNWKRYKDEQDKLKKELDSKRN